ncbi:UNVERIFIED_CONTAM: hypothetical protein K2H54_004473, partial [Gekko kuhli]
MAWRSLEPAGRRTTTAAASRLNASGSSEGVAASTEERSAEFGSQSGETEIHRHQRKRPDRKQPRPKIVRVP